MKPLSEPLIVKLADCLIRADEKILGGAKSRASTRADMGVGIGEVP